MVTTFERARMDDFEELVDLANYVFSHSGGRVDYPSLLPKLYNPVYRTAEHHVVAKEDGRIRAIVGAFPIPVEVAGQRLLACGIGTVCVHPYRRSSGYMKTLMQMAHDGMRQAGADFGCLGGQRQRYQYFGYDRCGQLAHFEINRANIRHVYGATHTPRYAFRQMVQGDPALDACRALFAARPAHAVRAPERFLDIVASWESIAWIMEEEGVFKGYLVASKEGDGIHELAPATGVFHADVVADWIVGHGNKKVSVVLPPYEQEGMDALSRLAESMQLEAADNMAVFRFDTTVHAFFKLKATYESLPDGCLVLSVEGHPSFRMEAANGTVHAEQTDDPAHLVLSYTDALAFLFSPLGGLCAPGLERRGIPGPAGFGSAERALARAWFPLPLFFDKADNV